MSCLFALGCGRVGFAPIRGDGGGSASDASADASTACQTWSAYAGGVDEALSLTGTDDWLPHVSRDGRSLIVDTYNGADFDLLVSRRATVSSAFPVATPLAGVSAVGVTEQAGQFSADESRLYVFLYNAGGQYELWQYTLVGGSYVPAFEHTLHSDQQHFHISDDERRLYTIEVRGAMGALMMSERTDVTAPFPASTDVLVRVGKPGMTIALSPDELEMIISVPPVSATDFLDLFYTRRTAIGAPFGVLTPLSELNTPFDDIVGSWSADLTTLYVNLDTDTNGGRDADVTILTRSCLD